MVRIFCFWDIFYIAKRVYVDTKITYTYYQEDNSAVHDGKLEKIIPFLRILSKWGNTKIIDNQEKIIFSYMFLETIWNWLRKGFYRNYGRYDSNSVRVLEKELKEKAKVLTHYINTKEHRAYIMENLNIISDNVKNGVKSYLPNNCRTLYIYMVPMIKPEWWLIG